jgi:hypothetical protein
MDDKIAINTTTMYITMALAALTFIIPRKYFLFPYVLAACFIPTDQRIVIMNLNFTVLRMLIVVGILRIIVFNEYVHVKWNNFDKILLLWITCGAVIYVIQRMDAKALINRSGVLFDAVGLYWLFRQKIRSWHDVEYAFRFLGFSVLLLAPLVAVEWGSGHNPFAIIGTVTTAIREGRYRCQASFPHSIMLGLFWATIIPIFIGLATAAQRRVFYWIATAAAAFIVISAASSTPIATMLEILLLLALFNYRRYGRVMVYSLCGLAIILHSTMEAPVWHLISRVNIVGGSTGWHRFYLIDQTIKHFGEWALLGTPDTTSWGWGLVDITNQYVLEGVRGGLITLILFVILLVMAVRTVCGYSLRPMPYKQQWFVWCICVAILGHCLSFVGVSYFGQITMLLYLIFAIVGLIYEMSLSESVVCAKAVAAPLEKNENGRLRCHS